MLVCLGNPGDQYENTRHNVGFMVADQLGERYRLPIQKLKFKALTNIFSISGEKVLVMKPQTYMNLSGESVGEAARFYKIPADHVVVISDDISLPVGKLRIRTGGSAGGHNGLKNIIQHLGTDQFPRIKVGVGAPGQAGYDVVFDAARQMPAITAPQCRPFVPEGDEAVQDAVDALQEVCGLEEQTIAYLLRYEYGDELVRKLAAGLR